MNVSPELEDFPGMSDEELRARLTSNPEEWTPVELLEATERFGESYALVAILHELRIIRVQNGLILNALK